MQRVVLISYRRYGTTYQSHPQGSRIQQKACTPKTEFIKGRVWAVKSLSRMVSNNKVVASGWMKGCVVVSVVGKRHSMIE